MLPVIRVFLLALGAWFILSVPAAAAIAVVGGTKTTDGTDQTMTFDAAPATNEHVLIAAMVYNQTGTLDLTGITATETILINGVAHGSVALRLFVLCFAGDGADATVVLDSSHNTRAAGV